MKYTNEEIEFLKLELRQRELEVNHVENVLSVRNNEIKGLKKSLSELIPLAQNHASILLWDEEYSGDGIRGKEAQEIVNNAKKLIGL